MEPLGTLMLLLDRFLKCYASCVFLPGYFKAQLRIYIRLVGLGIQKG